MRTFARTICGFATLLLAFLFFDHDVPSNVRYLTDGVGAITDTYDYDAFGNLTAATGSSVNLYLFTGQQYDLDLGLYYLRARYHNPDTGRFWTQDSYEGSGSDPSSLHKYTYCGNNPVNSYDPSGRMTLGETMTAGAISGSIVGSFWGMFNAAEHGGNITDMLWGGLQGGVMGAMFGAVPGAAWATTSGKVIISMFSAMGLNQAVEEMKSGYWGSATLDALLSFAPLMLTPSQLTEAMTVRYGVAAEMGVPALYDEKFAVQQLLEYGQLSLNRLKGFVPEGTPNNFKPSSTIEFGQKYQFEINGAQIEVKFHSPDAVAAAKFPNSASGSQWTAQIKVNGKLLGADGLFYSKPSNLTHIKITEIP